MEGELGGGSRCVQLPGPGHQWLELPGLMLRSRGRSGLPTSCGDETQLGLFLHSLLFPGLPEAPEVLWTVQRELSLSPFPNHRESP